MVSMESKESKNRHFYFKLKKAPTRADEPDITTTRPIYRYDLGAGSLKIVPRMDQMIE